MELMDVSMVRVRYPDGSVIWEPQHDVETRADRTCMVDKTPLKLAKSQSVYTLNVPQPDQVKKKIVDEAFLIINQLQDEFTSDLRRKYNL